MSKTVADASRDYRQRQRAKLERYEAALKEIAYASYDVGGSPVMSSIAKDALQDQ